MYKKSTDLNSYNSTSKNKSLYTPSYTNSQAFLNNNIQLENNKTDYKSGPGFQNSVIVSQSIGNPVPNFNAYNPSGMIVNQGNSIHAKNNFDEQVSHSKFSTKFFHSKLENSSISHPN
jgi:hypothetical protein